MFKYNFASYCLFCHKIPCQGVCCGATSRGVISSHGLYYYAALLPRRGPHIASHSVCLSVRLSVCPSVPLSIVTERHVAPPSELQWHTCTFRQGLHIVRPSRPHKFLFIMKSYARSPRYTIRIKGKSKILSIQRPNNIKFWTLTP